MASESTTLVTRLTPPGKSAIACLGVAGPMAWATIRSLFRRPNQQPLPETPTAPSLFFGSLGDAASGADSVVLFVRQIEPIVALEINCHGGPEVLRLLESLFAKRGIKVADAETWTGTIHGPEYAAILEIVARCPTIRTAAIALDQLHGACARAFVEIDTLLAANRRDDALPRIARLRDLVPVGSHLVRPWKVALVGPPNVGKSSLVNALAGFPRSVVAPTPGTTRDVVSTAIALDGWPIELLDTAGLREAGDSLEAEGIARGRSASAEADLVLRIADATVPEKTNAGPRDLLVVNKIDLLPPGIERSANFADALFVSARSGDGLDRLAAAIVNRLVPSPPQPGDAVPIAALHSESLDRLSEIARIGLG